MTYEEAQTRYLEILRHCVDEEDAIYEKAKENGLIMPGLDSNRELFRECKERHWRMIEELKMQYLAEKDNV